jgi:sugar-specific transcriptional regulator TrmB
MGNNLKENLIRLGFTDNEAGVYLALLSLKSSPAGSIISQTQLHRNVVYTALSHLVAKKLISEKIVRGVKCFSINTPNTLREDFEQKAEIAKNVALDITQRIGNDLQEITIHQGNEEYLQLLSGLLKSMPKNSTKYVIGTGGEDFMQETMRPIWKKYHKIAHAQRIHIKMIAYENQKQALIHDVSKEGIYEIKYLPNNIENPAGIHVYPEIGMVLNIIYSTKETPVTAICIRNKALTQGYLNLFNNFWNLGKE